jgi:hypothetical protein
MSAGDDQVSLDDSSSFPDQVAVNRFSMSASIFPRERGPLPYSSSSGRSGSLFLTRASSRAARSDCVLPRGHQ